MLIVWNMMTVKIRKLRIMPKDEWEKEGDRARE